MLTVKKGIKNCINTEYRPGDEVVIIYNSHPYEEEYNKLYIGKKGRVFSLEPAYIEVEFEDIKGCTYGVEYNESSEDWIRIRKYVPVREMLKEVYVC